MLRRTLLQTTPLLLGALATPLGALAQSLAAPLPAAPGPIDRLAAAWRTAPGTGAPHAGRDFLGVLELDWDARQVRIAASVLLTERVHGLLTEPDGGFVAVGARPGHTLVRCDAAGQLVRRFSVDDELPQRTLDGHITASADGQSLYTMETDRSTGQGWVSVRDRSTLKKTAQWPSHGIDPHQCLVDADGHLMLVNGGIPRTADGNKRDLHLMAPSLVRLDARTGALLGQWRLTDPRLSLRHLAWSHGPVAHAEAAGTPLLGVALQAEHDDPAARKEAPALAVWDGTDLRIPSRSAVGAGYAGDIAPGPGGGFILSGQKVGKGLLWHPDAPGDLRTIAELRELCALSTWHQTAGSSGVLIGSPRGVARWHPAESPAMLAWPLDMSPDNHWVTLA
jgi:hypothetical protein